MQECKPDPEEPMEDEFNNPAKGLVFGVLMALVFWVIVCGIAALVLHYVE